MHGGEQCRPLSSIQSDDKNALCTSGYQYSGFHDSRYSRGGFVHLPELISAILKKEVILFSEAF